MLLSILLAASLVAAAPHPSPQAAPTVVTDKEKAGKIEQKKSVEEETPAPAVSSHSVSVGGKEIRYTATAGILPIVNDAGETEGRIFFVAYTVDRTAKEKRRPLLFLFNGGPGAASVWLHLGAAGPRRVRMLADGSMPPPPYTLVDNEYTWLDAADLVFVDPVGTGYSRAARPDLTNKFTSVHGDIDSLATFIRMYLTRYDRWTSPLFLVGESYGTFRAAGLSRHLAEHGIALNGIVMISPILNFQTISFDHGNDLPYALFLPAYAATAWYHKKLGTDTDLLDTIRAAETWAETDYLTALARGDRLSAAERHSVVDKLSGFTSLDKNFIESHNLRIDSASFSAELLRGQRLMVGIMDSRFTALNTNPSGSPAFDVTISTVRPPFTATFDNYVRTELGFQSDLEYFALGGGIGKWDWEAKNSYADTASDLTAAFARNPYMKLFAASGYFDLATPYSSGEYTLAHLGLTPDLRKNITTRIYPAGHMMYLDSSVIPLLKRDVEEFIGSALKEP